MVSKYRIIHERRSRTGAVTALSEKELMAKARKIFHKMKRRQVIKRIVAEMGNTSIRFDLMGIPETSFYIGINDGELKFSTDKIFPNLAVGIHKEYFAKLVENPPQLGSVETIIDNISLRKGRVREFKRLKSILLSTVLGGSKNWQRKSRDT